MARTARRTARARRPVRTLQGTVGRWAVIVAAWCLLVAMVAAVVGWGVSLLTTPETGMVVAGFVLAVGISTQIPDMRRTLTYARSLPTIDPETSR